MVADRPRPTTAATAGVRLRSPSDGARLRRRHRDGRRVRRGRRRAGRRPRQSSSTSRSTPLLEAGDLLYAGPWVAERLAGLSRFLAAHPDAVLPVTRAVLERGRDFTAVDAFRARHRLQELRAGPTGSGRAPTCCCCPTVPTTFTRAEIAEEPVARNLVLGRYTQFANLLDLAAVAVPAGSTADGRPVGVTLLGPAFTEAPPARRRHTS